MPAPRSPPLSQPAQCLRSRSLPVAHCPGRPAQAPAAASAAQGWLQDHSLQTPAPSHPQQRCGQGWGSPSGAPRRSQPQAATGPTSVGPPPLLAQGLVEGCQTLDPPAGGPPPGRTRCAPAAAGWRPHWWPGRTCTPRAQPPPPPCAPPSAAPAWCAATDCNKIWLMLYTCMKESGLPRAPPPAAPAWVHCDMPKKRG